MTEKEIKMILECCTSGKNCEECSLNCEAPTTKDILDLINRQQAEIGRLTTLSELGKTRANDYRVMRDRALKAETEVERLKAGVNVELENYASEYDSKIKAEAIKEFAERLKKEKYSVCAGHGMSECVVSVYDINNLVKEMVGK